MSVLYLENERDVEERKVLHLAKIEAAIGGCSD